MYDSCEVTLVYCAGLFLLSGVFDLRPLLETSHNVVLKMTQYETVIIVSSNSAVMKITPKNWISIKAKPHTHCYSL